METTSRARLVGGFVIAGLAALIASALWVTRYAPAAARAPYEVRFTEPIDGLAPGAHVTYHGVRVGSVTSIRLAPDDPAVVIVRVAVRAHLPLRADTVARLRRNLVTGIAHVALDGGSRESPPIVATHGDTIAVIASQPSPLGELITGAPAVMAHADALISRVTRVIDAHEVALAHTLTRVSAAADRLARAGAQLDAALAGLPAMMRAITGAADGVQTLSVRTRDVVTTDAAHALQRLASLADTVDAVARAGGEDLDRITTDGLANLTALAAQTRQTLRDVDRLVRQLRDAPQSIVLGARVPEYDPAASR